MTRSSDWGAIADLAIEAFEGRDVGGEESHAYAYMAGVIARRHGWNEPRVASYLATVYDMRKPDGGWGLTYAWDAFGDGTINPASTTYTVTNTDHVGRVFVDAVTAGSALVPMADVKALVTLTMSTYTYDSGNGKSISYSRAAADKITVANGRDVHNVSGLAAEFLMRANGIGADATGLAVRIVDLTRRLSAKYSGNWWPYRASGAAADTDHTAALAEVMYHLELWMGREVAVRILRADPSDPQTDDNAMWPIALARLVGMPGRDGSWSRVEPGVTLWAQMGDQHIARCNAFVADPPSTRSLSQMAYWAARNAEVT